MFVYWKVQERMDWGAPTLSWRHPQRQLLSLAGLCIAGACLQGWPLWLAILRGLACLFPGLQETLGQCSVWGMCLSQKRSQGQGCGYSFYNRIFFLWICYIFTWHKVQVVKKRLTIQRCPSHPVPQFSFLEFLIFHVCGGEDSKTKGVQISRGGHP